MQKGAVYRLPRSLGPGRLGLLQIDRRCLALLAALQFEADLLPLMQIAQAGALDRGNMHEHVLRAVLGLNEAVALLGIEPLYGSNTHCRPSQKNYPRSKETAMSTRDTGRDSGSGAMRKEQPAER